MTDILSIQQPYKLVTTKILNGMWTAYAEIPIDDYIGAEHYVTIDSEDYIAKRVRKIKDKGRSYFAVDLDHIMTELNDYSIDRGYKTGTATQVLAYVLYSTDGSYAWTTGTVNVLDTITLKIRERRTSTMEALYQLVEQNYGQLYFNSSTRTVDYKIQIGSTTGHQIRYDKNAYYIEKEEDSRKLVTRIYPMGSDNLGMYITPLQECNDATEWTIAGSGTLYDDTVYQFRGTSDIEARSTVQNDIIQCDLGAGGVIDLSGHDYIHFYITPILANNVDWLQFGFGEGAWNDNTYTCASDYVCGTGSSHHVVVDISGVADASKNAVRYLGFKILTAGTRTFMFDDIYAQGYQGAYIDSANKALYQNQKDYVLHLNTNVDSRLDSKADIYLDAYDQPILKYKVKMADLSKAIPTTWTSETLSLGDYVQVYDSDLGINVSCQIYKLTKDLLTGDIDIELSNLVERVTDNLAEMQRKLYWIMPYNDKKTIIDARQIQAGKMGITVP